MKNKIQDLRNHLFETLEALKDTENPMDIARARAISGCGTRSPWQRAGSSGKDIGVMGMSRTVFMDMIRECREADQRKEWMNMPDPKRRVRKRESATWDRTDELKHKGLISIAADLAGTDYDLVMSECRKKEPVYARLLICMCLSRRDYSSGRIGKVLRRHHTSILHLLNLGRQRYKKDSEFRAKVNGIRRETTSKGINEVCSTSTKHPGCGAHHATAAN